MMPNCFQTSRVKKSKKSSSNGKEHSSISELSLSLIVFLNRGLSDANLKFMKFRFNQSFHLIGADNFLKDLFNDKTV
jgi:hypothetical protein